MDAGPLSSTVRDALTEHHRDAWGWTLRCCGHDHDVALDVLHDVYVKVLDGRARYGWRSSFKTWLFGVIRLTARSARTRRAWTGLFFAPMEMAADVPAGGLDAECAAAGSEVRTALRSLPSRQRNIIELVFFHDLTVMEAAEVLGVSVGAARQHYARAKKNLRAKLELRSCDDDR